MGRINKKLQAKQAKKGAASISKSAVLATLASNDKKEEDEDRYDKINFSKPKVLPKTLDELEKCSDFLMLLDKPEFKERCGSKADPMARIKKKDKMKMKKDLFRKKLHVADVLKNEEKATKKRKQTAIVGDMKPMADTLQIIDDIIKEDDEIKAKKEKQKKKKPSKAVQKRKKVQEDFLKNISIFKQAKNHPQFKKDPFNTISTHLENKVILEAMNK